MSDRRWWHASEANWNAAVGLFREVLDEAGR